MITNFVRIEIQNCTIEADGREKYINDTRLQMDLFWV